MSTAPWAVVASIAGGAVTTMLGVLIGGLLARRTQAGHWLKDTKATTYAALLREYTRVEFDLRIAYLNQRAPEVDWAPWGAALTGLSLVAEDAVITAADRIAETFVRLDEHVHSGERNEDQWRTLQNELVDAQMEFVNTARQSLDRGQAPLRTRVGGPLIAK